MVFPSACGRNVNLDDEAGKKRNPNMIVRDRQITETTAEHHITCLNPFPNDKF